MAKTKIGKFLKRLWDTISGLFHGLDDFTKGTLIPVASGIVDALKKIDESHIGDVLSAVIPGDAPKEIRDKLHDWLPKTIIALGTLQDIADTADINEKLKKILGALNVSPDDAQKVFYHGLASLILERLADGKFDWSDATAISELYYQHILKGKK